MLLGPGLPDLRRFRVELLDEAPGVVAVTDQPRFEIIELTQDVSGGENPRIDGASYSGVAAFDCLFAAG
jgi:hypothetical protein